MKLAFLLHFQRHANVSKERTSLADIDGAPKFRITFTSLSVSSQRLQIEAGRWSKPHSTPRNERLILCRFCNKLGDEFHLLFECILYNQLGQELIN